MTDLEVFLRADSGGLWWGLSVVIVVQLLSCVQLFATPWTAAHQASLSFSVSWSLLKLMSIESMIAEGCRSNKLPGLSTQLVQRSLVGRLQGFVPLKGHCAGGWWSCSLESSGELQGPLAPPQVSLNQHLCARARASCAFVFNAPPGGVKVQSGLRTTGLDYRKSTPTFIFRGCVHAQLGQTL